MRGQMYRLIITSNYNFSLTFPFDFFLMLLQRYANNKEQTIIRSHLVKRYSDKVNLLSLCGASATPLCPSTYWWAKVAAISSKTTIRLLGGRNTS